jgi:hypothetical protein
MRNFIKRPLYFGCERFVSTNHKIDEPQTEPGYLMWPYNHEYSERERLLDVFQAGVAGRPLLSMEGALVPEWHEGRD